MTNIDYDTGKLNWIIGDPNNWSEEKQKYFFKPVGNNFEWQYEQHACVITPNGDVMCFDNHHNDTKFEAEALPAKDSYSRGVRYRIDTDKMEIEQVWSYGKERGADFFSPYICNVIYYNEGHYLVHSGGIAYTKDGKPSDALGPFAIQAGGYQKSITTEVYEDKKMYELKVDGNFYRAKKLTLYCDGNNLELGEGKILGKNRVCAEMETEIPAEDKGELMPEFCAAKVTDQFDMFMFEAKFVKGDLVMLQLEKGEEVHRYYISTTATPNKAMCVGTFIDTDDRQTRTIITKEGLSGKYNLTCIINDTKYQTGVTIEC
jgi:arylsulfate sulfotransferase